MAKLSISDDWWTAPSEDREGRTVMVTGRRSVVTDLLHDKLRRDPVAVMTGIYTGAGERNWVFYAVTLKAFQAVLNEALSTIDEQLPLTFHAEEDPEWEEYHEMCQCEIAREE